MRLILLLVIVLVLQGCASGPTVARYGKDTYAIVIDDVMGFSSGQELELQAVEKANEYCTKLNKVTQVTNTQNRGIKWFPSSAKVIFLCIDENDPYNHRQMYEQPANIRIENR